MYELYIVISVIICLSIIYTIYYIQSTSNQPSPIVGSNKCTWGPSYWCSSIENARECNMTWNDCQKYITQSPTPSQP